MAITYIFCDDNAWLSQCLASSQSSQSSQYILITFKCSDISSLFSNAVVYTCKQVGENKECCQTYDCTVTSDDVTMVIRILSYYDIYYNKCNVWNPAVINSIIPYFKKHILDAVFGIEMIGSDSCSSTCNHKDIKIVTYHYNDNTSDAPTYLDFPSTIIILYLYFKVYNVDDIILDLTHSGDCTSIRIDHIYQSPIVSHDNEITTINAIIDKCCSFCSHLTASNRDLIARIVSITVSRNIALSGLSNKDVNFILSLCDDRRTETINSLLNPSSTCKCIPTVDEGISVYEFFSGIGGMRLSLPSVIDGIPVKSITAFDCNSVANAVYLENFHNTSRNQVVCTDSNDNIINSRLCSGLVDSLAEKDVDNKADVWTMSPPCQPFTTTKFSHRLDEKDCRSRGLFHIMYLLMRIQYRPRYIFVENVTGFLSSEVLKIYKMVLKRCGYVWKQYVLSPINYGIPNQRNRYYMTAVYVGSSSSKEYTDDDAVYNTIHDLNTTAMQEQPCKLEEYINKIKISDDEMVGLLIRKFVLEAPWSISRLSIVTASERDTFCFTKSYSQTYDKSAGSYLLITPVADEIPSTSTVDIVDSCNSNNSDEIDSIDATGTKIIDDTATSTATAHPSFAHLYGQVRYFHPNEVLAISGFPDNFRWPSNFNLRQKYACIGNSLNVSLVKLLMNHFFTTAKGTHIASIIE